MSCPRLPVHDVIYVPHRFSKVQNVPNSKLVCSQDFEYGRLEY